MTGPLTPHPLSLELTPKRKKIKQKKHLRLPCVPGILIRNIVDPVEYEGFVATLDNQNTYQKQG